MHADQGLSKVQVCATSYEMHPRVSSGAVRVICPFEGNSVSADPSLHLCVLVRIIEIAFKS